jgi:hypothetical protein
MNGMVKPNHTVLITGLPRSGTTLICSLLNQMPNTLALAEPIKIKKDGNREHALSLIEEFINQSRSAALSQGTVMTKQMNGAIPDNWVEPPNGEGRLRKVLEEYGPLTISKALSLNFTLVIKHPAEFTALSDELSARYPLFAIVRHPLAVLAAWQTVDMPVHRGRMPKAESFCPELAIELAAEPDRIERQIKLIRWLFAKYNQFPEGMVIRYEDLTRKPHQALAKITQISADVHFQIKSFNVADRYAGIDLKSIAERLIKHRQEFEKHYPDFIESTFNEIDKTKD